MKKERFAQIRTARKKDIGPIYELGKKTLELSFSKEMTFHDKSEFKEFISHPKDNILLIAEREGEVIGFLYAKIISRTWCLLDSLTVKREYRKHGIGTQLLTGLYKMLKEDKVTYVQILEQINQKKTRRFWREQGFKEEKVFIWADRRLKG